MKILTEQQQREVVNILTEKPFECDHAYFFHLEHDKVMPIGEASLKLYQGYKAILDALPAETVKGWPGNIVAGPRDANLARFYASYRFATTMLVLSKTVPVAAGERVMSPFNKYFLDAVSASVSRAIGFQKGRIPAPPQQVLPQQEPVEFKELIAWRECKDLWREKYGPGKWLAIKGGQPVAKAATLESLTSEVRRLGIVPPVLIVPPSDQETVSDAWAST